MGICTKDEDQQLQQLDHSNLDKNLSSIIIVGDGDIAISNAQVRGHRLEGLKWSQGTSKPKQRSQSRKETINVKGGTQGVWGVGDSKYHNLDPLCRLIGPKNDVEVVVNTGQVINLVDSGTLQSVWHLQNIIICLFGNCNNS